MGDKERLHERIERLNDAIEGKARVTYVVMEAMVAEYVSPSRRFRPTRDEVMDPKVRWLAMMADMARTIRELAAIEEAEAKRRTRREGNPLPVIPVTKRELREDERSFVACYVEWHCI